MYFKRFVSSLATKMGFRKSANLGVSSIPYVRQFIHSLVTPAGIRKLCSVSSSRKGRSLLDGVKMEVNFKLLSELRNNYWMIQKLGCGGFGKVYLIKNRESKELGAAKHQKWTSSDVPKLVRREVLVLRKLLNQVNLYLPNFVMQLLNI